MNDPCHIQFLVNPDRRTIAIKVCGRHSRLAHRINYKTNADCEFYSKELLCQLCTLCPDLISGYTYRLFGVLYADKGLVLFRIDQLTPAGKQATIKTND